MKKYLILSLMFLMGSAYAMCPVENGETVCSLPGYREQLTPTYNANPTINQFSGEPEARLTPINKNEVHEQFRNFAPAESDYSYNSSCQFGVCMQNRSTPLFQQPKQ